MAIAVEIFAFCLSVDLTNKCHVSTDRFLSPLQGLLSHDDVVFEDAVAPVCCKNIIIARKHSDSSAHLIAGGEAGAATHGHVSCGARILKKVWIF